MNLESSSSSAPEPLALSRRDALQRILALSAFASTGGLRLFGADSAEAARIGVDPNLLKKEIPWPRLLSGEEKRIVTALADLFIPPDELGPGASAVGVPDFIDEWVSGPYEPQMRDLKVIREGLSWIDGEAQQRFGKGFVASAPADQTAILNDIVTEGTPARARGRAFFLLLRDRVAGGYYTTPEGWKALGYSGDMPLAEFPGAPLEILAQLGLT